MLKVVIATHLDPEALRLALQIRQAHASNAAHTASKAEVNDLPAQTIRLKDLSSMVAAQQ